MSQFICMASIFKFHSVELYTVTKDTIITKSIQKDLIVRLSNCIQKTNFQLYY